MIIDWIIIGKHLHVYIRMHFVRRSVLYVTWKCARSLEWSPTLIFWKVMSKLTRVEVLYERARWGYVWRRRLRKYFGTSRTNWFGGATFKVIFVKINDLVGENKIEYGERRLIERDLGMHIEGEADVRNPERVFGIVPLGGRWYFGHYVESEPVWYHHIKTT